MFKSQIEEINKSINKTGKVIISLGCSFVQGQGAVDIEILEQYPEIYERFTNHNYLCNEDIVKELVNKYPLLTSNHPGIIDFTFMEYDNAFVNVLCRDYLNHEYTPVNLGRRGNGNRSSIKDLYFHPEIEWTKVNEYIVIFVPSGLERIDFISDIWDDHNKWVTMWPHYQDVNEYPRKSLWKAYNECLWSEKFEVLEQLAIVQELLTWCENKNAKLITIPAFDRRYNKDHFTDALCKKYHRDINQRITGVRVDSEQRDASLVNLFPWHTIFKPGGCDTFADFALSQEFPDDPNIHFYGFLKVGTPELWITPCAHPSAKSHRLLAEELFNFIRDSKND